MKNLAFAVRLLLRDGRSGELSILVLALIIAVTSTTAITLFTDRLQRTMTQQAADFMAADLVITSPAPLPAVWQAKADHLKLNKANTAEFSSVLIENDELLLAGIKSVTDSYPLRGYLKVTDSNYDQEQKRHRGPEVGQAWVEKRVLSALHLQIGDQLTVGEKPLTVSKIITYEPDKRGDLYSLSPRVMINARDLEATGVLKPGSHVHYFYQFSGDDKAIKAFHDWAKPLLNASQRIMDVHDDRPELGTALNRAEQYLSLSSIVVILIAGVAIAMATRRYTERHYDATALLRCLGYQQGQILRLYINQFLLIGVVASLIGCLLGYAAQYGLFYLLKNLLPQSLAEPSPLAVSLGFITGLATLFGFALPPILRIKKVSALRVLRRELDPLPSSAWFIYSLAMATIAGLILRFTGDLRLTATLLGSGLAALVLLGVLIRLMLYGLRKLTPHFGMNWRFAFQGLLNQPQATVSQVLAFSLTILAMVLSFNVRNDVLQDWRSKLPVNAPNHFALNIFPNQVEDFGNHLRQQNLTDNYFYPIVRGRLVAINETPVQKIVSKDSQGERATHRDLSLTWSKNLPPENHITAGSWWQSDQQNLVSIEFKLAESLQVGIGDRLKFTVGSEQLQATVSSIRQVEWDTMKPNFYMIFSPGTLDHYASTYLTSFYLPESLKPLLNDLVKRFPSITVLEVDLIIKQFETILAQLTQAIEYVLLFALLAGFTVLFAALYATLDARIYAGALLRTLGAGRKLLSFSQIIEFSLLGFLSGLLAVILAEIMTYVLYSRVLNMHFQPDWLLCLVVPTGAALLVCVAGCWGLRRVLNHAPMQVLRDV